MDVLDCIKSRRSIRSFKSKEVEDEKINEILDSAKYAPSAGNLQARDFIVVKDKKIKEKLSFASCGQIFISTAPVVFVVCADKSKASRYGERAVFYSLCDCCASIENMMLSGHYLGIGSCWVGAFDEPEVKKILNIPESIKVCALVPMGYPDGNPKAPDKKISLHFDTW